MKTGGADEKGNARRLGVLPAVLLPAMAVRAEKRETGYVVLTLPADWELAEPMRFT